MSKRPSNASKGRTDVAAATTIKKKKTMAFENAWSGSRQWSIQMQYGFLHRNHNQQISGR
jgi:hypothetical protein